MKQDNSNLGQNQNKNIQNLNQTEKKSDICQFLLKRERDEQSAQYPLIDKKGKIDDVDLKKYANIIQSTFPNHYNEISNKPLHYSNSITQRPYNGVQTQGISSGISNNFTYSTHYSRHNNLYNGRFNGNNFSNYVSPFGQYSGIGKTPYQYLRNSQSGGYGLNNNSASSLNHISTNHGTGNQTQAQLQFQSNCPNRSNVQEKAKYVIKDIPEMTFGNFLQNKGIQDMYLNGIKKKEEGIKDINISETKSPKIKEGNNTITNVNIPDYNPNYIASSGNNNIIIHSKTVAPQIKSEQSQDHIFNSNINKSLITTNEMTIGKKQNHISGFPQNNQEKKGDFPPMLQNYITRAFQRCKNNEDIGKCQRALLKIMENTNNQGDMYYRNWNDFPLPEISSFASTPEQTSMKQNSKNKQTKIPSNIPSQINSSVSDNFSNQLFFGSELIEKIEAYKPIIGTSTELEKDYYRMTEHPDCSLVRPEYILQKSLKMLLEKWNKKEADYSYVSIQFRSIRQDLTVQIIQNDFSVKVYETHSRIALESYDLPQFNQCQTALIPLYAKGIKGERNEFFAYRILYTSLFEKIEMGKIMCLINKNYKSKNYPKEILHAVQILKALNELNYFLFLKLYEIAPNMGKYLIEPFLPRLRIKALQVIAYGYYSEISIEFIKEKLRFKNNDDCLDFLNNNCLAIKDNKMLCRENIQKLNSNQLLSTLIVKK